jgi:hypothetical protein
VRVPCWLLVVHTLMEKEKEKEVNNNAARMKKKFAPQLE